MIKILKIIYRNLYNIIHNQDCIEGIKDLKSNSVDLIIADPPYNLSKNFGEWDEKKNKDNPNNLREEKSITFTPIHAYISYEKDKVKLLIVNLSEKTLVTDLNSVMAESKMTQYYAKPNETKAKVKNQTVNNKVELLPYSISLFEK